MSAADCTENQIKDLVIWVMELQWRLNAQFLDVLGYSQGSGKEGRTLRPATGMC